VLEQGWCGARFHHGFCRVRVSPALLGESGTVLGFGQASDHGFCRVKVSPHLVVVGIVLGFEQEVRGLGLGLGLASTGSWLA
jgi:hypothetical protein